MNILLILATTVQLLIGSVTYYNDRPMKATYQARIAWGHVTPCESCIGMIAVLDSENLNKVAYIKRPNKDWEGPFLIVDCAQAKHKEALRRRGLVAEVDYQTKLRWGYLPNQIEMLILPRHVE